MAVVVSGLMVALDGLSRGRCLRWCNALTEMDVPVIDDSRALQGSVDDGRALQMTLGPCRAL